jgi:O-antigen/teichoic acid export membrane protein
MSTGEQLPVEAPRRSFARTATLTYGTNVLVAAFGLANVLIIARALGPEGRGVVTFLVTISMISAVLSGFGIQQANANIAGREPETRPALATNALILALLFGGVAAIVLDGVFAVLPDVGPHQGQALMWLALSAIPITILRFSVSYLAMADYAFAATNTAWLLGPVVNVVANGAMALAGVLTVGAATATWVGGQALGVLLMAGYVQVRLAGFGRPDAGLAWRSLRFGAKAHGGNVMLAGNYRLDQWFTGSISGNRELGLYSVAVAWGEALFFLPTALAAVLRPDVVRGSAAEAARRTAAVFRAAVLITVPLAVGLFLVAPFLCATIFGAEFRGAIDDLRLLVPGAFGILALKLLAGSLTMQGKPMLETFAIGVAFVSTIALDVLLIPPFGGAGAALASSIAYSAGGVAAALLFVRSLGGRWGDLVPRPGEVPRLLGTLRGSIRRPSAAADG